MKPLTIGIIVCVIIAICVAIYFLTRTRQASSKSNIHQLLDEATGAFGIKISDNFTDVIFNTQLNIIENMSKFSEFAYPKLDLNEINKILNDNGLHKTMYKIFEEHKDISYDEFTSKFDIFNLLDTYSNLILDEPDETIYDHARLLLIILLFLENLILKNVIPLQQDIKLPNGTTIRLTDIYLELSSDFKLNDKLELYLRTNLNKNINKTDAQELSFGESDCILNATTLCKTTENVADSFKNERQLGITNILDIKRFVNLSFASSLFKLNGNDILFPQVLSNELGNLTTKLTNIGLIDTHQTPTPTTTQN